MVAPLIAAAGVQAGASLLGGIMGGKGAKKVAKIAAQTADKNRAFAQGIYDKNVGLAQPTVDRGNAAGAQINALLGLGGTAATTTPVTTDWAAYVRDNPWATDHWNKIQSGKIKFDGDINAFGKYHYDTYGNGWDLKPFQSGGVTTPAVDGSVAAANGLKLWQDSTGYRAQTDEGYRGINQGYAARGALESGAAQKALVRFGQQQAQGSLGQYLAALSGQQSAGLSGIGAVTGAGNNLVQSVTAANDSAGSAAAGGALYGAQANQNALAGVASSIAGYFGQSSYGNGRNFTAYQPGAFTTTPISTMTGYVPANPFGR